MEITTRSSGTPSTSATIWRKTVWAPVPVSGIAVIRRNLPSASRRSRTLASPGLAPPGEAQGGAGFDPGGGPAVEDGRRGGGDDATVRVHAGPERDDRRVPRAARHELFRVAHHDLHRTSRHAGQVVGERHVGEESLAAEVAPDRRRVDPDPLSRQLDCLRKLLLSRNGVLLQVQTCTRPRSSMLTTDARGSRYP